MASYSVITAFRTVQVLSPNTVVDVEYATSSTIPTGIIFNYGVPVDSFGVYDGQEGSGLLDTIAVQLEEMVTSLGVVAGSPSQDIDPSGLLTDFVDVVVRYNTTNGGVLYGTASIPITTFFTTDTGIGGFVPPHTKTPNDYVREVIGNLEDLGGPGGTLGA